MKQFKDQKIKLIRMLTRRNWLLRCSILINVAVLLYLCSHLLIGGGNFAIGPAYIISDESMMKPAAQYRTHIPAHLAQQLRQEERDAMLMQQQTQSQQQQQHSSVVLKIQENGVSF